MIVLCHGCFDILHIGHVRHLREAKAMGKVLVVSVSSDEMVRVKGEGRPIYPLAERMEVLAALRFVDHVIASPGVTGAESIRQVRPDIFCKGADYRDKGIRGEELDACRLVGASVRFTEAEKRSVREEMRRCGSW